MPNHPSAVLLLLQSPGAITRRVGRDQRVDVGAGEAINVM
jgi:hypothetical protein